MPKKLIPTLDRVVVIEDDAASVTKGGIHLPDQAQEKPVCGTIIEVGPGLLNQNGEKQPVRLKVGMKVYYSRFSGNDIELDEVVYKVLSEGEIQCICVDVPETEEE